MSCIMTLLVLQRRNCAKFKCEVKIPESFKIQFKFFKYQLFKYCNNIIVIPSLFAKLPRPGDSDGNLRSSCQAATCLLGQETATGICGLRVKLPPAYQSIRHGEVFTLSL